MMKQLKIRDLKILLDLVETKSFSLSAKNVGLTQASISKSIAAVEETLGIKIIDRESRPVRLTAFGETLLPNIRKYIIENDELFELVDHYKKAPSGEVNIFSPSGMQAYLAENILPPLFQRFPDLNVTITTSNHYNADYFKGVSFNNSCDMLISYSPPHNQNLIARKVKRIRMDVFATPAFFEHHPFTTPEELSRHPFILLSSMANNIYTAINCCRNGMGYMVTSHLLLKDTSGIMSVLPPEWGVFIDCYVIYRNRKNLPLRVQLSLDYIIELMTKEK